ncbi:MAG: hypothetical protein RR540_07340 [Oscillospiraceae bacterium]
MFFNRIKAYCGTSQAKFQKAQAILTLYGIKYSASVGGGDYTVIFGKNRPKSSTDRNFIYNIYVNAKDKAKVEEIFHKTSKNYTILKEKK